MCDCCAKPAVAFFAEQQDAKLHEMTIVLGDYDVRVSLREPLVDLPKAQKAAIVTELTRRLDDMVRHAIGG